MPIPVVGTGAVGLVLLAGVVVTAVAIPARCIWRHRRFGDIEPRHPEMKEARRRFRYAMWLWLAAPATLLIVAALPVVICKRMSSRRSCTFANPASGRPPLPNA